MNSKTDPAMTTFIQRAGESPNLIGEIIAAVKEHLEADVSFLAQFQGDRKVIKCGLGIEQGMSFPLSLTYCHRMVNGDLPNVVIDTRADPRVKDLEITSELDIGAYVGVPVILSSGRVYGSLCCIQHQPDSSIRNRDATFMRVLATLISRQLDREESAAEELDLKIKRIRDALDGNVMHMVFQPIVNLNTWEIVGAEALARFNTEPRRSPDKWFAEAWEVGLGAELETAAARSAGTQMPQFPDGVYMSVNVSPKTLQTNRSEFLDPQLANRIVVEITEHAVVEDYEDLLLAVDWLKGNKIRLAIDDAGAGYSGLSHILRVAPNIVKLDVTLIRGVDTDPAKQALVSAAVLFAARTRVKLVAEGVETKGEAEVLRVLGVPYGQGYYYAKPGPLPLKVQHTP